MDISRHKKSIIVTAIAAVAALSMQCNAADAQRQAAVAERGAEVMPFSLAATTHIFTKTTDGGLQRVTAKKPDDAEQTKLVRQHLQEMQEQFVKGDFSGPAHIHGEEMPGLALLRTAKPGQLTIHYKDVEGGAELEYQTTDPAMLTALHQWFDAQLSDHGSDAMAGHQHHHSDMPSH